MTMRAVRLRAFGPPGGLVVEDVPVPVVDDGQALIEVAFAGITFVETQLRATGTGPFPLQLPTILGNGVGGTVRAVGPGADPDLVGTTVVTSTGGSGGYAEQVAVDAAGLIAVPKGVPLDVAVALLADGRTAVMLVALARLGPEDRVLVEAAVGGVGVLLVQLARAAGATVVAAVGGPRKVDLARRLGADLVVDYRDETWPDQVRTGAGDLSVVFDGVGGTVARSAFGLLGRDGRMVSFGRASGDWACIAVETATERNVALVTVPRPTPEETRTYTEHALTEAAAGRLRPLIGQRFPLEQAAQAHAAIESRSTVGKTLLEVRPPVP